MIKVWHSGIQTTSGNEQKWFVTIKVFKRLNILLPRKGIINCADFVYHFKTHFPLNC